MARIAPSQRIGGELVGVLTRGVTADAARTELRGRVIRLGMQRLLQELLEAEQAEFIGAGRYERGGGRDGQRNGYEPAHLDTGEGRIDLEAPQIRNSPQRFQSKLLASLAGRTDTVERPVSEM
jgi:transposase-like protein